MKRSATICLALLLVPVFVALDVHAIEVKSKPASGPPTADSAGATRANAPIPAARGGSAAAESAAALPGGGQPAVKGSRERSSKNTLLERLKRSVREAQKKETQPQYDRLIDNNNDGVDDRIETPPPAKAAAKPAAERKPRTDSTRKAPPK